MSFKRESDEASSFAGSEPSCFLLCHFVQIAVIHLRIGTNHLIDTYLPNVICAAVEIVKRFFANHEFQHRFRNMGGDIRPLLADERALL